MSLSKYLITITCIYTNNILFDGFFEVDSKTSLLVSFFSNSEPNKNILIPTGSGVTNDNYYEEFNLYYYEYIYYDNALKHDWINFDFNGIILNSLPGYDNIDFISLSSNNIGDELITKLGSLYLFFNDTSYINYTTINNIRPYVNIIQDRFRFFNKPLFTDNSSTYYKPGSLYNGNNSVVNYRHKK